MHETPHYESMMINTLCILIPLQESLACSQLCQMAFSVILVVSTTLKSRTASIGWPLCLYHNPKNHLGIAWDPQHVYGVGLLYPPYIVYFAFPGLQDCVFLGAGGPSLTEYQSIIFYHNSSPKWNETIKVQFYTDSHFAGVLTSAF